MRTLAPTEVLRLQAAGHDVAVTARPAGWPSYFDAAALAEFRRLDWYARRARHAAHDCYLTATRVFVGAYDAANGGEITAQLRVIAEALPAVAAAGVPVPEADELSYSVFAGSPTRKSPGFLTPLPVQAGPGVIVQSVQIDC